MSVVWEEAINPPTRNVASPWEYLLPLHPWNVHPPPSQSPFSHPPPPILPIHTLPPPNLPIHTLPPPNLPFHTLPLPFSLFTLSPLPLPLLTSSPVPFSQFTPFPLPNSLHTLPTPHSPVLVDESVEGQPILPATAEVLHIHSWVAVEERGERRGKRCSASHRTCQLSHRDKAKQRHNTLYLIYLRRRNKLPQTGLKLKTYCLPGRCSTN